MLLRLILLDHSVYHLRLYELRCPSPPPQSTSPSVPYNVLIAEEDKREGKSRRCCLMDGVDLIPCRTTDLARKKWMDRKRDTWRNGCFGKMDDLPVPTTTNHHPPKMDVLSKIFLQIFLAAKWLVQHSSTSPKQQQRPLPSLLSNSSSMSYQNCTLLYGVQCHNTYRSSLDTKQSMK